MLDPGVPQLSETALTDRIGRDKPVVVLFYADWCPFCEAFMPVFRENKKAFDDELVAANISHPEDPRWEAWGIETIPTLVAYAGGEERDRLEAEAGVGLTEEDLVAWADSSPAGTE